MKHTHFQLIALTLFACFGCFKAGTAAEAPESEDATVDPGLELAVAVVEEPEVPALPPIHPPLEANQAFLIDFTQQKVGEGWYIADHDVPNGQWKNDFRASSVNFSEEGMDLSIEIKDEWMPNDWFWDGAEVTTEETFHYGYYEVEMKAAKGSGLVSSLFTYTGPFHGTHHDEIDIEFLGNRPEHVEFNVFQDGESHGAKRYKLDFDASEEFHHYGFDWQPDYIHWYLNGEIVHRFEQAEFVPKLRKKIMVNLWTGNMPEWHGHAQFEPGAKAQYRCLSFSPGKEKTPTCFDRARG
ncbi:MAG: family 16 glycosylhydrolase [Pseudomonadota bacterium]